jgi:uncharacterized protein YacL (UPF0231 family)
MKMETLAYAKKLEQRIQVAEHELNWFKESKELIVESNQGMMLNEDRELGYRYYHLSVATSLKVIEELEAELLKEVEVSKQLLESL